MQYYHLTGTPRRWRKAVNNAPLVGVDRASFTRLLMAVVDWCHQLFWLHESKRTRRRSPSSSSS